MSKRPYRLDKNKIWTRSDANEFGYSDGDNEENRILEILRNSRDLSLASDELQSQIVDWPSEYHLTPTRVNLMHPLRYDSFDSILEIGSGCGAITRFLGENTRDVTALEGSYRRASITRERCRDLDNVKVFSDDFESFQAEKSFDMVTLIGVLEYSPMFFKAQNGIRAALEKTLDLLTDEGICLIAIENQLGLKYFGGCTEDHAGKHFWGIEDRYAPNTFATFGKQALKNLLLLSGYAHAEFLYPFPDYKLPQVILTDEAFDNPLFGSGQLIGQYPSRDYSGRKITIFDESRVWKVLDKNGVAPDFSNSFFVVASKGKKRLKDIKDSWLALSYSGARKKRNLSFNRFEKKDDELVVVKQSIYPNGTEGNGLLRFKPAEEPYYQGKLLCEKEPSLDQGDQIQDFIQRLNPWVSFLESNIVNPEDKDAPKRLPPEFIDCTPFNLIETDKGELVYFDQEWVLKRDLGLDFMVFRGVFQELFRNREQFEEAGMFLDHSGFSWLNLVFQGLGYCFDQEKIEEFIDREAEIQAEVGTAGKERIKVIFMNLMNDVGKTDTLEENGQDGSVRSFDIDKKSLLKEKRQLELRVKELERDLGKITEMIHETWASSSWKIGRALTYVPRKSSHKTAKIQKLTKMASPKVQMAVKNPQKIPDYVFKVLDSIKKGGFKGLETRLTQTISSWDYPGFAEQYYQLTSKDKKAIQKMVDRLPQKPLFSVLMPVYNAPEKWLREAIESVRAQIYPHWEFCIADDNSTEGYVHEILREYEQKDSRIRVVYRKENGHISEASNSALEIAQGDYVVLLDHDDLLTQDALACIAYEINQNPEIRLIYSDEDKIDEKGLLSDPYFKSDWNPDLILSHNFVSHLGVYQTEIMKRIGGFRKGFEGAQDWDLCLRFIDHIQPAQICHIPKVLYHWRILSGSTAKDIGEKPYVVSSQQRSIEEALKRRNKPDAKVNIETRLNALRVRYPLEKQPLVSLIIPTKDQLKHLKRCIESIRSKTDYDNYELIVIDNQSQKPKTKEFLAKLIQEPNTKVFPFEQPFNFSSINNFAAKKASGEILVLVNNDIEAVDPGWLTEMVSHAVRKEIGAVGARLLYPNKHIQHAGVVAGIFGTAGHAHKHFASDSPGRNGRASLIQNFSAVTAACLAVRKSVYFEVGGMNEKDLAVCFGDVDFCFKIAQQGYSNLYTPYAELIHHESVTRKGDDTPEKQKRFEQEAAYFKRNWGKMIDNDPFYNPNLTLEKEDFSLAYPPKVYKPWEKYL